MCALPVFETYGVRGCYVALALLPMFALPFVLLFFHPGRAAKGSAADAEPLSAAELPVKTLAEAVSSYRFWLLLASILAMYLGITGIVPNLIPALKIGRAHV